MAMESGKAYVKSLVAKAPKPDELEAMGDMEPDEPDADGDQAALESAYDDFVAAIGSKDRAAGIAALKDLISYCR